MAGLLANYQIQPSPPMRALRHLPGSPGLPLVGHSFEFLADPLAYARRIHAAYGPVSRTSFLFEPRAMLLSAEANELVLTDRNRNFSAHLGWQPVLGKLFPRGLMLRDGDDHRYHRRLMQPAFRKEALATYLDRMTPRIARTIARWRETGSFPFYPAVKHLTLEIAADVFLGVELQSEIDQFERDFHDVVEASTAVNRLPGIGRLFERGLSARARLERFLHERIPARRETPGTDLFSQLCAATDENGARYSDAEIVDHLIFLMMAAHDTTTSALTTIVYALAREPGWQGRLRELVQGIGK
ncbi:MAG TPA: cytochrome P450, partial [Nevskiaceae bacterium]|nr:cytochrome P450 [Nevskiaceae bacterium]